MSLASLLARVPSNPSRAESGCSCTTGDEKAGKDKHGSMLHGLSVSQAVKLHISGSDWAQCKLFLLVVMSQGVMLHTSASY